MLQYTVKRILLVIPTFFMISLLIFLVLNIAPGRPGATGGAGQGESQNQEQQESYRIFKEQFNLDKPILVNTRYTLDADDARELLVTAYSIGGQASAKDRIAASDALSEYGAYLVRPLVELLDDADPAVRRKALDALVVAGQQPFENDRRGDDDARAAARDANKRIAAENQTLKERRLSADADDADIEAAAEAWKAWYLGHEDRYTYTLSEQVEIFFLDTRFAKYWGNLLHLDFGVSTVDRRPVMETLLGKLKYSLTLSTLAIIIAYSVAVPIGIFSAVRQGTRLDAAITVGLFVMYSLPTFFTGTVLLKLFTEGDPFAVFPTGDFQTMTSDPMTTWTLTKDIAWHLVLPIATYTSVALAALSRYARSGVIDVIRADYIRTARAKGLSEPVVILKHAVRNGMIPILTLLGGLLPSLVAGSVVIEVVFNIPGMGQYLYSSINLRDYNAVMAVLLASSFLALIGILLSDLSYALVDPRISFD
ncbi:MAG: ABC transporter permease subunit [Alphaproteobacteria bacterium]|nr:ABC transporter permease subunit [Alphaproteobacteria bacterium]